MKVVGVSACPTGIAHTYLAADAIEAAAQKLGYECKVETQGSIGIENKLTQKEVDEADLVILTVAVSPRDSDRFEGHEGKTLKVSLQKTIESIETIMEEYFKTYSK